MAILTKAQLEALNQSSFPDQSTEAITPAILRNYNTQTIDTLVDSLDTGSFATSAITASSLITASVSGQIMTFTKGNGNTFDVTLPAGSGSSTIPAGTVSSSAQIVGLGFLQTSSFNSYTASAAISITNLNASSASQQVSINNLNTTSASLLVETQNLELFSASALVSISNINSATASLFTSASLALTTASVSGTTMTFRKGDGTTFNVTLPTGSGGSTINTGSFATTGSNTFTGPNTFEQQVDIKNGSGLLLYSNTNNALDSVGVRNESGSLLVVKIGATNKVDLQNLSLLVSGTFTSSLQQGYVWVGDSTGKTKTVATSSFGGGGTINTGSFATTGSNSFNGDQNVTGSVRVSQQLQVGTVNLGPTIQALPSGTPLGDTGLQINAGESGSFSMRTLYGGQVGTATLEAYNTFPNPTTGGKIFAKSVGGSEIQGIGGNVTISGSNTTLQGLRYPNTDGTNGQVITTNGSGVLTFTTVSGGTINTGSFATTGSNTFRGTQTIQTGNLVMGNGFTISAASGDITNLSAGNTIQFITEPPAGPGGTNDIKFINRVTGSSIIFENTQGGSGNRIDLTGGEIRLFANAVSGSNGEITIGSNTRVINASNTPIVAAAVTASALLVNGNQRIVGNQTITGSVTISGSSGNDLVVEGRQLITGPTTGQTPQLLISSSNSNNVIDSRQYTIGKPGFDYPLFSAQYLNSSSLLISYTDVLTATASFNVGVFDNAFTQDVELFIDTTTTNGVQFKDIRSDTGAYVTFLKIAPNGGTNPPLEFKRAMQITGSLDIQNTLTASLQQGYVWVGDAAGRTTTVATSSFGGGGTINTGSFAITGSNTFRGNQTITGSVFISSSGGLGLSNTDGANVQYFGNSFGSNIGVYKVSDATEIGLALDGAAWTTNWGNGPIIYVNNTPGDTYEGVFGFQNKTNYTDGRITALKPLDVRGNTTITGSLTISSSAATDLAVIGNSVFTGSVTISGSSEFDLTIAGRQLITGPTAGQTPQLLISGSDFNNRIGRSTAYINKAGRNFGSGYAYGRLDAFANLNEAAILNLGVFDEPDFVTDIELLVQVDTGSGIQFQDIRNDNYAYSTWMSIAPNTGNNPPLEFKRGMQITGSLSIQSGSALPVSTGSAILTWNASTGRVTQAPFSSILSASVSSGEFWSTTTQSGSAGVSGSIQFNNSGSFYNTSVVNGTQLQVANGGVYNIQFSAQIETSAGADTLWIWFKKNGNNIGASASKAVLANNTAQIMTVNILDEAVANDYYEIAYQNLNGNATILSEAASGNIPAIPSVIATIFQIR